MTSQCKRIVTINLKPLDCLPLEMLKRRPQYPRILVYEPIPPVCQPANEPIFSAPGAAMGVTIKVCNYSRMCQACRPPPLCDCKPIPPPLPPGKLLIQRIIYVTKLAIFLVVVKWFYDIGLLGDQRRSKELAEDIKEQLNNFFYTKRGCVQSKATKYDMARITYNLKNVWNIIVASIVRTLESIPPALATLPAIIAPPKKKEPEVKDDKKKGGKKKPDKKDKKPADKKDAKKEPDKGKGKKEPEKGKGKKEPEKGKGKKEPEKAKGKKEPEKAKGKKEPEKAKAKQPPPKGKKGAAEPEKKDLGPPICP